VLGQLGRRYVGLDEPAAVADQGFEQTSHRLEAPRRTRSHEDPAGMEGVLDTLALPEELGVGDHLDLVHQVRTLGP
jgi:hypothetical protein